MFHRFFGGIHPSGSIGNTEGKELARDAAIEAMPAPGVVTIPLSQHIGAPCKPCVKPGDVVKRGQCIATTDAFLHADIHASVAGKVKKIENGAVLIENDGTDAWAEGLPLQRDWHAMEKDELLAAIRDAGIVGMGGATFPAFVKLQPKKNVDVLILNGSECEPFLTADDRLMREEPDCVAEGARILARVLSVRRIVIAVEENKPEAADTSLDKSLPKIEVLTLPTRYPEGAEKMLIYAVTGREVPLGGLPMDAGAVVQNVGTAAAVFDACVHGIPLIERVTTVSGDAIAHPKNLRVRIGTSYQDAIDYCGGFVGTPDKVLAGAEKHGTRPRAALHPLRPLRAGVPDGAGSQHAQHPRAAQGCREGAR